MNIEIQQTEKGHAWIVVRGGEFVRENGVISVKPSPPPPSVPEWNADLGGIWPVLNIMKGEPYGQALGSN